MLRGLLEAVVPFLLPFLVYGLVLAALRRFPALGTAMSRRHLGRLAVIGLALAVAVVLLGGLIGPRHEGAYVPAHLDHGRLVPGRMQ